MNGQMDIKGRRTGAVRSMSMDNILGDPFALATISISVVSSPLPLPAGLVHSTPGHVTDERIQQLAWLIAFVGSVIATSQHLNPNPFPNFSWFAIAFMFCLIIGIFVVVASDTTQTYHVALVGFLSSGLILTSSSVNSLIYSSNGAKEAAAAGFILLSMVDVRRASFMVVRMLR
jgi:SHO1 osmosensor